MRHANRDADHLNTLRQYYAQNRRIPSYQRIADLLGFASRAATAGHPLRIRVTVEIGENGQVDQSVVDKVNAVLAVVKAGWKAD